MKKIKFSISNIENSHIQDVKKILKSGWLTHGKYTELFENKFKDLTKSKFAITVSSCTAGLHLICIASGFKKGDEVIVPAMSHTATSHAVEYTGAKAIFCDVNLPSGNVSIETIKKKITNKTKGIIVVHMAGSPCDMVSISNLCKRKGIKLIEDCAHAVGTTFNQKHAGNFGIAGSFSFYPTKQITTGEGGMIISNNQKFFLKLKRLKQFGIDKDIKDRKRQGEYDVVDLGYNYRMTDFQSSLGYNQIINYKNNLKKRHIIAKRYIQNFKDNQKITHMFYSKECSFFVFQIFCKKRNELLKFLKNKNIGVSVHYINPLPKMKYYKDKYNLKISNFKNAQKYADSNISLPIYPKLSLKEVDLISSTINRFLNEK